MKYILYVFFIFVIFPFPSWGIFNFDDPNYYYPKQQLENDYYSPVTRESLFGFYEAHNEIRCIRGKRDQIACDRSHLDSMSFRRRVTKINGMDAYLLSLMVKRFRKPEVLASGGQIVLLSHKMMNDVISVLLICTVKVAFPISMAQQTTDCFVFIDSFKKDSKTVILEGENNGKVIFKDPKWVEMILTFLKYDIQKPVFSSRIFVDFKWSEQRSTQNSNFSLHCYKNNKHKVECEMRMIFDKKNNDSLGFDG